MKFVNRGGTSVLSAIREGAKHVSEQNGIATMKLVDDSAVKHSIEEAFGVMPNSTNSTNSTNTMSSQTPFTNSVTPQSTINPRVEGKSGVNVSNAFEDKLVNKLQKCIETLADTGEYYNAVDALFTLHTMGALTDGVVDSITRRDLKEIKSIVKEFKDIVDSF